MHQASCSLDGDGERALPTCRTKANCLPVRLRPGSIRGDELRGMATLDDVLSILAEELGLLVSAIDSEGDRERHMRR